MNDDLLDHPVSPDVERRVRAAVREMVPKLLPAADLEAPVTAARIGAAPSSRRPRIAAAAAALLAAAAVIGVIAVSATSRRGEPGIGGSSPVTVDGPSATTPLDAGPAATASLPPVPVTSPAAGDLLSTVVPLDAAPLVVLDREGWQLTSLTGTDDLPTGDLTMNRYVIVGGAGDQQTWFQAWASEDPAGDAAGAQPVDVDGAAGHATVRESDPSSGLDGLIVHLWWPLTDGRTAHATSLRLPLEVTAGLAADLDFDPPAPPAPAMAVPEGFTRIEPTTASPWLSFGYWYGDGDRTLELNGQNLAAISLLAQVGTGRAADRPAGEVAVTVDPSTPDAPEASWQLGDWLYTARGEGLSGEDELLTLVHALQLADPGTFAAAAAPDVDVLLPGDRLPLVQELEQGVLLPANTPMVEWPVSPVATSPRDFAFRFYLGLACAWRTTWMRGDVTAHDSAVAGVESIAARAEQVGDVSPEPYTELAGWMRAGDTEEVTSFGSNDCPTWSQQLG